MTKLLRPGSHGLLSGSMNPTSEKGSRNYRHIRDQDLPWHLYHSHSAWFGIRVLTQYDLDDIRSFRESIFHAPKDEAAKVVTAIQTCIDDCLMDPASTSERLKLLQDIGSSFDLLPESYWVPRITKGKRISVGGEATVYLGDRGGETVVVREFHPLESDGLNEPEIDHVKKVVIREIIAHWQLRHPNVVAVIGIHQFDNESFPSMILQRAEHPSAIKYLESHPGTQSFLKLVCGLLEAIHYLHTRSPPIIHGDLHDRNLVVSRSGDCLLCDFGLSRIRHEVSRTHTTIHQGGRQRFVAPEISSGMESRINERSDIYSLAMTIYALGTMSKPFTHIANDMAACQAARVGERPQIPNSLGGLAINDTAFLWSLMEGMWNHSPLCRPTVSTIRHEIMQNGLTPLGVTASPVTVSTNTPPLTPTVSDQNQSPPPTISQTNSPAPLHGSTVQTLPGSARVHPVALDNQGGASQPPDCLDLQNIADFVVGAHPSSCFSSPPPPYASPMLPSPRTPPSFAFVDKYRQAPPGEGAEQRMSMSPAETIQQTRQRSATPPFAGIGAHGRSPSLQPLQLPSPVTSAAPMSNSPQQPTFPSHMQTPPSDPRQIRRSTSTTEIAIDDRRQGIHDAPAEDYARRNQQAQHQLGTSPQAHSQQTSHPTSPSVRPTGPNQGPYPPPTTQSHPRSVQDPAVAADPKTRQGQYGEKADASNIPPPMYGPPTVISSAPPPSLHRRSAMIRHSRGQVEHTDQLIDLSPLQIAPPPPPRQLRGLQPRPHAQQPPQIVQPAYVPSVQQQPPVNAHVPQNQSLQTSQMGYGQPNDPVPNASGSTSLQGDHPGARTETLEDGTRILFYVRALYDYSAATDEDLDFQAGDIIAVTETPEDGWWSGALLDDARRTPGRTAFPCNFVCLY